MCNGQPFSLPANWQFERSANDEAAEAIAKIAAEQAGKPLCPFIDQCHQDCLNILNRHADAVPGEHIQCDVDILCQDPDKFVSERVLIPVGLLAKR